MLGQAISFRTECLDFPFSRARTPRQLLRVSIHSKLANNIQDRGSPFLSKTFIFHIRITAINNNDFRKIVTKK